MTTDEIRERFLRFFEGRGHRIYPSDSLVPANDPTLLFTGAGMNQFKEEFLGRVKGPERAATCQKCLRTGDLDKVGETPDHHSFFEMLGNFSFGDYFKKEAIAWAWEFLTRELGLQGSDLWVSVYKDDKEAYDIWRDAIRLPEGRILRLGEGENFWPANAPSKGPNGPCGPCSEIFYGGPDGVEVWNLVFTQFDRRDKGRLEPLPNKNIDTGMGLERIARVMQGKGTNFEIDSFRPIIDAIRGFLKPGLTEHTKEINAVADHIRAVTFAVGDGVLPSNEERGYVIRKLIRKAFWYGRSMGIEGPFLYKIVPAVARVMKKVYPELTRQREDIAQVVLSEENRFKDTIQDGLQRLNEIIEDSRPSGVIRGEAVFRLYDTYGFPLELSQEIARENNISIDTEAFKKCMDGQRVKSRQKSKIRDSIFALEGDMKIRLPDPAPFIEDKEEITTMVTRLVAPGDMKKRGSYRIFLKETNFYGEKGGQVGDTGWLIKDNGIVADVVNAVDIAGRVQHEARIKKGTLNEGDNVIAKVDIGRREEIKKNHTATHLLHSALRQVLGQHVKQAGSLVASDRLRFDFSHFKALTKDEIQRVEGLVNTNIKRHTPVSIRQLALKEAKEQGAIALFGEKYSDQVRMVSIGDYSRELCGGTHVKEIGEIGIFKIVSESSIASGVRRIEAVTGEAAKKKIKEEREMIRQIADELKTVPAGILKKIEDISAEFRAIEKGLEGFSIKNAQSNVVPLLKNRLRIKGHDVVIAEIKNVNMTLLRKSADVMKDRLENGVFVLLSEKDGRLSMVVGTQSGLDAVKILNDLGAGFGIRGGGRPDFAQAGGRAGAEIEGILKKAEEVIKREIG